MQTHVVTQGIGEAVGTDVRIVRPQEQLACSGRVPGLGLVHADRHVVPHPEQQMCRGSSKMTGSASRSA